MSPEIIFCLIFPFGLGAIANTYWLFWVPVREMLEREWGEYYQALEEWNEKHV